MRKYDAYFLHIDGRVFIYSEHRILKGQIIELWLNNQVDIKRIEFKDVNKKYKGYVV